MSFIAILKNLYTTTGFPGGSGGKESACNAGDLASIPGLERSPGGRHGNPLQYSCLENPHGQKSLVGYIPWGRKEMDMTERLSTAWYITTATTQEQWRTSQQASNSQSLPSAAMFQSLLGAVRSYYLKETRNSDFYIKTHYFKYWQPIQKI